LELLWSCARRWHPAGHSQERALGRQRSGNACRSAAGIRSIRSDRQRPRRPGKRSRILRFLHRFARSCASMSIRSDRRCPSRPGKRSRILRFARCFAHVVRTSQGQPLDISNHMVVEPHPAGIIAVLECCFCSGSVLFGGFVKACPWLHASQGQQNSALLACFAGVAQLQGWQPARRSVLRRRARQAGLAGEGV